MRIKRQTYFEDEEIVSLNLVDLFCTVLEDAGLGSQKIGNSLILDDVLRTVEEKKLRKNHSWQAVHRLGCRDQLQEPFACFTAAFLDPECQLHKLVV